MPWILWATNKEGEGYTQEVARFDDLEELHIRAGFFSKDIVLRLTYEKPDLEKV